MDKQKFIKDCLVREFGEGAKEILMLACEGGPSGMRARQKFVLATKKCQKHYCDAMAVEKIVELVAKSPKPQAEALLKIMKEHEECSPNKCELEREDI